MIWYYQQDKNKILNHTKIGWIRSYPKNLRLDSSNFNPYRNFNNNSSIFIDGSTNYCHEHSNEWLPVSTNEKILLKRIKIYNGVSIKTKLHIRKELSCTSIKKNFNNSSFSIKNILQFNVKKKISSNLSNSYETILLLQWYESEYWGSKMEVIYLTH